MSYPSKHNAHCVALIISGQWRFCGVFLRKMNACKLYLVTCAVLGLAIFSVGLIGCSTIPAADVGHAVGVGLTNTAPVLSAAAGAAAGVPAAAPYAVPLGALAALFSAVGGFLVRHYAGAVGQKNQPTITGANTSKK